VVAGRDVEVEIGKGVENRPLSLRERQPNFGPAVNPASEPNDIGKESPGHGEKDFKIGGHVA